MLRLLWATLGAAATLGGIVVQAVIVVAWAPCYGDRIPFDETVSLECAAIASAGPVPWVWKLWPLAVVLGSTAIASTARRGISRRMCAVLIALGVTVVAAFPLFEYSYLAPATGAWDSAAWEGSMTAISIMFAGAVLLAAGRRRVRTGVDGRVAA